jgi:hypothetical protein
VDVQADGGGSPVGVARAKRVDDVPVLAQRSFEVPAQAQRAGHVTAHALDQLGVYLDQPSVAGQRHETQVEALVRVEEALHRPPAHRAAHLLVERFERHDVAVVEALGGKARGEDTGSCARQPCDGRNA